MIWGMGLKRWMMVWVVMVGWAGLWGCGPRRWRRVRRGRGYSGAGGAGDGGVVATPRVISTVPAATYNLMLIGAMDRVVGISAYDRPF